MYIHIQMYCRENKKEIVSQSNYSSKTQSQDYIFKESEHSTKNQDR